MPELPEVETVRRGLAPAFENATFRKVVQRRADLRFPFPENFVSRLEGQKVTALTRRAKYLLADLSGGEVLILHLGMSGSFRVEGNVVGTFHHERSAALKHDHVEFYFSSGAIVTYNDPRRFGFMDLVARAHLGEHAFFRRLGIEPLGNALNGTVLQELFRGKAAPLKAALLDQSLIAGLGNIYVCESLFRAGLSPERAAGALSGEEAERLSTIIRAVLEEAIAAGGSTLNDFSHTDGTLGYFQHRFQVYDREDEPCLTPGCRGVIGRQVQGGRSTFHCPVCQK